MNFPTLPLPADHLERTYAGVLGKIIGVYLGRPFEMWPHERIQRELGEIRGYVHERLGKPLVVTDDDLTGTFGFFRALTDRGCPADLTPAQVGETWLNLIIEQRTILWWGGIGKSTEHTAWHRLARGIPAPASGSIALNGKTVAEQIGAQIFIDAWGLANPGDPGRAADFARRAATVSHDGVAVHGAQVVAAMVAAAFVTADIDALIDAGLAQIPADSLIRRLADDIRAWHAEAPDDWRRTLARIQDRYSPDRFPGGCHMVPNHALIHLALRHGAGDFARSQRIVNTAGWDTDCNAGNVGCILGVARGLAAFEGGVDWRGPVADRLFLPTAEGGATVTDAARETVAVANAARRLRGLAPLAPKGGARWHFSLPGSVQGFVAERGRGHLAGLVLENVAHGGDRALAWRMEGLVPGQPASARSATFTPPDMLDIEGYAMVACPVLHPGQVVRARWLAPATNPFALAVRPVIRLLGESRALVAIEGPASSLEPGREAVLEWEIPSTDGQPIADLGFAVASERPGDAMLLLDSVDWSGSPTCSLMPPARGDLWRRAWAGTIETVVGGHGRERIFLRHGNPGGLLVQGSRDWTDYAFRAEFSVLLAAACGIVVRAQGLRRHLALRLTPDGWMRLVRTCDGTEVLAEAPCPWVLERTRTLEFTVDGDRLRAIVDGIHVLEARDGTLRGGAVGFLLDEGSVDVESAAVAAIRNGR